MRHPRTFRASIPCFLAVTLASAHVRAQVDSSDDAGTSSAQSCSGTTAAGGEVVAIGSNGQPQRWIVKDGTPVNDTDNLRAENLNPWGISFSDCSEDMRLDFSVTIANFTPGAEAHLEVWAGAGVDCSVDANRYVNNAAVSRPCWPVAAPTGTQVAGSSPISLTVSVYAWDVLRYEQPPTQSGVPQTFDPNFHSNISNSSICGTAQTSDAAVPFNLYFLALDSAGHTVGQPGCYVLGTDLVGPPAPPQVTVKPGDTLLAVSWTSPGNDPDLVGFDVWSDPPAGGATNGSSIAGCGCSIAPGAQPSDEAAEDDSISPFATDAAEEPSAESGSPLDSSADAPDAEEDGGADAAADAPPDAATDAVADGASASGDGGARSDAGLADGGASETDAAVCTSVNLTAYSSIVGNGGISTINAKYHADSLASTTPPTSSSPLTLTGMTNGKSYTVVVTSMDAYGNDGPASAAECGVPQKVTDFWSSYAGSNPGVSTCAFDAGGTSGGSTAIPGLLLATGAALIRRRSRRGPRHSGARGNN